MIYIRWVKFSLVGEQPPPLATAMAGWRSAAFTPSSSPLGAASIASDSSMISTGPRGSPN